jgi:hypothetical protein
LKFYIFIIFINLTFLTFLAVANNDVDEENRILAFSILSILQSLWKEMEEKIESQVELNHPASPLLDHVKTNYLL